MLKYENIFNGKVVEAINYLLTQPVSIANLNFLRTFCPDFNKERNFLIENFKKHEEKIKEQDEETIREFNEFLKCDTCLNYLPDNILEKVPAISLENDNLLKSLMKPKPVELKAVESPAA